MRLEECNYTFPPLCGDSGDQGRQRPCASLANNMFFPSWFFQASLESIKVGTGQIVGDQSLRCCCSWLQNSPWKQCDASFFTVRLKRSTRGKHRQTQKHNSAPKWAKNDKTSLFFSVADESSSGIFVRYLSTCSALHWNRRRLLQLKDKYSAFHSVKVPGTHYLQTQIWS